jgi:Domain of unknown function (DUF4258)
MHERILQRFRDSVRSLHYVVTLHAEEEMDEDGLSVFDLESAVLTGEIVERQRDRQTREWKYVVNGKGLDGGTVAVVGKLSPTGCLVIITVYRD